MDRQGLIDLTLNAAIEIEKFRQKKTQQLPNLSTLVKVLSEEKIDDQQNSKTYLMDLRNLAAYHNAWMETFHDKFDSLEAFYSAFGEFLKRSIQNRSDENLSLAKQLCLALNHQFIASERWPVRTRQSDRSEAD